MSEGYESIAASSLPEMVHLNFAHDVSASVVLILCQTVYLSRPDGRTDEKVEDCPRRQRQIHPQIYCNCFPDCLTVVEPSSLLPLPPQVRSWKAHLSRSRVCLNQLLLCIWPDSWGDQLSFKFRALLICTITTLYPGPEIVAYPPTPSDVND